MTVQELIAFLEQYSPNAIVLLDCGDVNQVEADNVAQTKDKRYIVIS